MEMRRLAWADGVVAELDELRRFAAGVFTFEQVTDALLAGSIGQDFVAVRDVFTAADVFPGMELHHVVLDADGLHVGGVAGAVIGLHLVKGFAVVFLGFLFKHRVEIAAQQERIDRLPDAVPVGQRPVFYVFIVKYAVSSFLFRLGHLVAVGMGVQLAAHQHRPQSHCNFTNMSCQDNVLTPF